MRFTRLGSLWWLLSVSCSMKTPQPVYPFAFIDIWVVSKCPLYNWCCSEYLCTWFLVQMWESLLVNMSRRGILGSLGVSISSIMWPNFSKEQNKWTNIKQKQGHRYREQTGGCQGGGRWGDERNRWGGLRGTNFQLQNKRVNEYEVYGVGNIVDNNGMAYGDTWYVDLSWGSFCNVQKCQITVLCTRN